MIFIDCYSYNFVVIVIVIVIVVIVFEISLQYYFANSAYVQEKCVYCGLGELEMCSPLVVGQSRAEHEAVLKLAAQKPTANGVFPDATGTTVLFLNQVNINIK